MRNLNAKYLRTGPNKRKMFIKILLIVYQDCEEVCNRRSMLIGKTLHLLHKST